MSITKGIILPSEERKFSSGDNFSDTLEQLKILGATGPPGWNANWALEFGYTKPGETHTLSTKCYSSRTTNVEVLVSIQTGDVSTVNLLNRHDSGCKFKFLINCSLVLSVIIRELASLLIIYAFN